MLRVYLIILILCQPSYAEEKVEIKYKEYEKIDLGDFSVQGDVVTPGDLSVKDRKIKFINSELFERKKFDDYSSLDKIFYK